MTDPSKSNEERLKALKNAMKYHNNYKLDAMSGRASDRTLFGLMAASKITNLEKQPKLFDLSVRIPKLFGSRVGGGKVGPDRRRRDGDGRRGRRGARGRGRAQGAQVGFSEVFVVTGQPFPKC